MSSRGASTASSAPPAERVYFQVVGLNIHPPLRFKLSPTTPFSVLMGHVPAESLRPEHTRPQARFNGAVPTKEEQAASAPVFMWQNLHLSPSMTPQQVGMRTGENNVNVISVVYPAASPRRVHDAPTELRIEAASARAASIGGSGGGNGTPRRASSATRIRNAVSPLIGPASSGSLYNMSNGGSGVGGAVPPIIAAMHPSQQQQIDVVSLTSPSEGPATPRSVRFADRYADNNNSGSPLFSRFRSPRKSASPERQPQPLHPQPSSAAAAPAHATTYRAPSASSSSPLRGTGNEYGSVLHTTRSGPTTDDRDHVIASQGAELQRLQAELAAARNNNNSNSAPTPNTYSNNYNYNYSGGSSTNQNDFHNNNNNNSSRYDAPQSPPVEYGAQPQPQPHVELPFGGMERGVMALLEAERRRGEALVAEARREEQTRAAEMVAKAAAAAALAASPQRGGAGTAGFTTTTYEYNSNTSATPTAASTTRRDAPSAPRSTSNINHAASAVPAAVSVSHGLSPMQRYMASTPGLGIAHVLGGGGGGSSDNNKSYTAPTTTTAIAATTAQDVDASGAVHTPRGYTSTTATTTTTATAADGGSSSGRRPTTTKRSIISPSSDRLVYDNSTNDSSSSNKAAITAAPSSSTTAQTGPPVPVPVVTTASSVHQQQQPGVVQQQQQPSAPPPSDAASAAAAAEVQRYRDAFFASLTNSSTQQQEQPPYQQHQFQQPPPAPAAASATGESSIVMPTPALPYQSLYASPAAAATPTTAAAAAAVAPSPAPASNGALAAKMRELALQNEALKTSVLLQRQESVEAQRRAESDSRKLAEQQAKLEGLRRDNARLALELEERRRPSWERGALDDHNAHHQYPMSSTSSSPAAAYYQHHHALPSQSPLHAIAACGTDSVAHGAHSAARTPHRGGACALDYRPEDEVVAARYVSERTAAARAAAPLFPASLSQSAYGGDHSRGLNGFSGNGNGNMSPSRTSRAQAVGPASATPGRR